MLMISGRQSVYTLKRKKRAKYNFIGTLSRYRWMTEGTCAGFSFLERDRFNPLDFPAGERELFGLEVFFHMLLARGSGQR